MFKTLKLSITVAVVAVIALLTIRLAALIPDFKAKDEIRAQKIYIKKSSESIDSVARIAFSRGRNAAEAYVRVEVGKFINALKEKSPGFISAQSSYWNVQSMAAKSLWATVKCKILGGDAQREMLAVIESQYSSLVVSAEKARMTLDMITRGSVKVYIETAKNAINEESVDFEGGVEFAAAIEDISNIALRTNTDRAFPLAVKIGVGGGSLLTAAIAERIAQRAGISAGKLILKNSLKTVGMAIGAMVLAFEVYDARVTSAEAEKNLRLSLDEYYKVLEPALIDGIMQTVIQLEIRLQSEVKGI